MKKTSDERIRALFANHSVPPLEVIIPIIEKAGRGEHELTAQVYDTYTILADGIREILGLEEKNMKTLAKLWEFVVGFEGQRFDPIELSDSRYSVSISDCPMLHVGKDVGYSVKSKFCDAVCTGGSKALMDNVLGPDRATCTWDKALLRGAGKCTVVFESVRTG